MKTGKRDNNNMTELQERKGGQHIKQWEKGSTCGEKKNGKEGQPQRGQAS